MKKGRLLRSIASSAALGDYMFDSFSDRSLRVIMLARINAGGRGTGALQVGDLLSAIIIEDQGGFQDAAQNLLGAGSVVWARDSGVANTEAEAHPESRPPFFHPSIAAAILARLKANTEESNPTSMSEEIRLSDRVKKALAEACRLQLELGQDRVEPLHIVGALAGDASSEAGRILMESGITREGILRALRDEAI
jgi:hypothetical protein